jgi:hypothetical protein
MKLKVNGKITKLTNHINFNKLKYRGMTLDIVYVLNKYFLVYIGNEQEGQINVLYDLTLANCLWRARKFILKYNKLEI